MVLNRIFTHQTIRATRHAQTRATQSIRVEPSFAQFAQLDALFVPLTCLRSNVLSAKWFH